MSLSNPTPRGSSPDWISRTIDRQPLPRFAIGASVLGRECETLVSIPFEEAAMLLTSRFTPGTPNRWFRAATILARAACGLLIHALVRPCQLAAISRTTGKVVAR